MSAHNHRPSGVIVISAKGFEMKDKIRWNQANAFVKHGYAKWVKPGVSIQRLKRTEEEIEIDAKDSCQYGWYNTEHLGQKWITSQPASGELMLKSPAQRIFPIPQRDRTLA